MCKCILSHSTYAIVREPFGVLGKLTQFELCSCDIATKHTVRIPKICRAHGSLSGSWENSHKMNAPFLRSCGIATKHTVRIPGRSQYTREPFGVLGKLTQNERSVIAQLTNKRQNARSGYQKLRRAHGSLSGSWENSHKSNTFSCASERLNYQTRVTGKRGNTR